MYGENNQLSNWKEFRLMLKSKRYIELEVLIIINIFSFLGAIAVSYNAADVLHFFSPQLFIATLILILYTQKSFDRFIATNRMKNLFLISIIILSIVSRPKLILVGFDTIKLKHEMTNFM